MITKKEDLINTYIVNDNGVLRDAYLSLCVKFGFEVRHEFGWYGEYFVMCEPEDWFSVDTAGNEWTSEYSSKQLHLSDLIELENSKVYTADPEVIRKYAELCGVDYNHDTTPVGGVYVGVSCIEECVVIERFTDDSDVNLGKWKTTTITPDQINALHAEKFGKVEAKGMSEPKNGEWWMCDRGGVNTVLLRLEDDWRGDDNDTYSYHDAVPLYKMKKVDMVESVLLEMSGLSPVIDVDGKLYTADDVRDLLPKAKPTKGAEWNGEGLPPIGVECEVCFNGHWHRFIPRSYHRKPDGDECVLGDMIEHGCDEWEAGYCDIGFDFRKPETPQQREERERLEEIDKMSKIVEMKNGSAGNAYKKYCTALYDAGYRKQKDGE